VATERPCRSQPSRCEGRHALRATYIHRSLDTWPALPSRCQYAVRKDRNADQQYQEQEIESHEAIQPIREILSAKFGLGLRMFFDDFDIEFVGKEVTRALSQEHLRGRVFGLILRVDRAGIFGF
jgi:hypothetical protein